MTQLTPLNQRDRQLLGMRTIQSQLPIYFGLPAEEGLPRPRVERLGITCSSCKKDIREESQRGMLTLFSPHEIRYEAIGLCTPCEHYTRAYFFIDSSFRLKTLRNGRWVYQDGQKKARNKGFSFKTFASHLRKWLT